MSIKSFYWIIDHRAPWYVPRWEPHLVQMPIALITAGLACAFAVPFGIALGAHSLVAGGLAALALVMFWRWCRTLRQYVVRIPDDEGAYPRLRDYETRHALSEMQQSYSMHPGLRPVIEPVLTASYPLARALKDRAVQERAVAVRDLVRDAERAAADPEVDNADLNELRNILKIRQQMRTDGLL